MIFVTVGTHEQQFNRLVKKVDELKGEGLIKEDVLIQTGYTTYEPKNCDWKQWIPYQDMIQYVKKAHIVITHGGPSSFIMPLQMGKTPIVVPRKHEYNEHVNNHQVEFCRLVYSKYHTILLAESIELVGEIILNYESLINKIKNSPILQNSLVFNQKLEQILKELRDE